MMPETTIEITCPRCKHVWTEDIRNVEILSTVMYRDLSSARSRPDVMRCRVRCPVEDRYVIVDVRDES